MCLLINIGYFYFCVLSSIFRYLSKKRIVIIDVLGSYAVVAGATAGAAATGALTTALLALAGK